VVLRSPDGSREYLADTGGKQLSDRRKEKETKIAVSRGTEKKGTAICF